MMTLLAGRIAVLTLDLLHVLTPQIAVVFADIMRQYLLLGHRIVLASIAVKSGGSHQHNISGLRRLEHYYRRLLVLRHHWYRLLLLLFRCCLLLLLLLQLLLLQISLLPVAWRIRSAILCRVGWEILTVLLGLIHQLEHLLIWRSGSRAHRLKVLNSIGDLGDGGGCLLLLMMLVMMVRWLVVSLVVAIILIRVPTLIGILTRVLISTTTSSSTTTTSSVSSSSSRRRVEVSNRLIHSESTSSSWTTSSWSSWSHRLEWWGGHEGFDTWQTSASWSSSLLLRMLLHMGHWWWLHGDELRLEWLLMTHLGGGGVHLIHYVRRWYAVMMGHHVWSHWLKHLHLVLHLLLLGCRYSRHLLLLLLL